ncbi:hypothetical protein Tco_1317490 [Tanacetum coccineum]
MEILDTSDAIKKLAGYNYYISKKKESAKDKIVDEPEEQRVSPIKSGRGKGFMCYGDQAVNVLNKLKKDVRPRKTRSLTIAEEIVVGHVVKDPVVQSLLDLQKGSKASKHESLKQKKQAVVGEGSSNAPNKHYANSDTDNDAILYSSCLEESDNKTNDADDSDMDLLDDNPNGDDDAARFGASEVSLGIHVDVQATNILLQEMFLDENAYYTPSLPAKKIPYTGTTPQPSLLQSKAKQLMQKAKKNMRKINFKKVVTQKFREYDQKLSHDNQDPPNNHEGENKKKRRKVIGEAFSRSSRMVSKEVEARKRSTLLLLPRTIPQDTTSKNDFFKAEMSTITEENVYSDLRIKSVVRIMVKKKWGYGFLTTFVVRRSDDKEYEFIYADLSRLSLNDAEDMVEDIQLGMESYQQTLNLTKPIMFFEGIDQNIPFIMSRTHKRVVYLNQHNVKTFMKLSEVKKFSDVTLIKIRENLVDMVKKNKLGTGNKRLKGRDWTDKDVKKSNKMIDKTLKRREQLKRLEEYVRGRPKTVNSCTFVKPM